MNDMQKYVKSLSEHDTLEIIKSFEQFEREGSIGDAPIRYHAQEFLEERGIPTSGHIVMWMNMLAFECYRHFAHLYLSEK